MNQAKIVTLVDYLEIPIPEKMLEVKVPKSLIDKDLARAAKRHATITQETGPIQSGDIAIVELASADPDWQQENFHINVGLGYSDVELEQALVGMDVGKEKTVTVEGSAVTIHVNSIRRRHIPVLTNEHIQGLEIEDVGTIQQYSDHLFKEYGKMYAQRKVGQIASYVVDQMVAKSEIEIPDEIIQKRYDQQLAQVRKINNIAPETPTEDFLVDSIAKMLHKKVESLEHAQQLLWEDSRNDMACQAICMHYAQANQKEINREAYDALVANYAKENGSTIEETQQRYSYDDYLLFEPIGFFRQTYLPEQYVNQVAISLDGNS